MKTFIRSLFAVSIIALLAWMIYFLGKEKPAIQLVGSPQQQSESSVESEPVLYKSTETEWSYKSATIAQPSSCSSCASSLNTESTEWGAFSVFGEAGYRNFRGSGTYGVYFAPCQRFKVSGEYLTQRLKYDFTAGEKRKWVSQYAVGAEYEYLLPSSFFQSVDVGASYSHAFRRKLSTEHIDSNEILKRGIAGSDGVFSYLGTTVRLWSCAFLSADANYDYVKYHRKWESGRLANGWGGSFSFVQQFARDFTLTLGSEFRKPFNYYGGTLNWGHLYAPLGITCGLYGGYTDGKRGVPNIGTVGIQLSFSLGSRASKCCRSVNTSSSSQNCYSRAFCDLSQWVSTPAVYIPVVLTIADEKLIEESTAVPPAAKAACSPPTSTTIPVQQIADFPNQTISISQYFQSSQPLTYSIVSTDLPPSANVSINPTTGVITLNGNGELGTTFTILVQATSSCGSTTQIVPVSMIPG